MFVLLCLVIAVCSVCIDEVCSPGGEGAVNQTGNIKIPPWVPIPLFLAIVATYNQAAGEKDKEGGDSKNLFKRIKIPLLGGKNESELDDAQKSVQKSADSSAKVERAVSAKAPGTDGGKVQTEVCGWLHHLLLCEAI